MPFQNNLCFPIKCYSFYYCRCRWLDRRLTGNDKWIANISQIDLWRQHWTLPKLFVAVKKPLQESCSCSVVSDYKDRSFNRDLQFFFYDKQYSCPFQMQILVAGQKSGGHMRAQGVLRKYFSVLIISQCKKDQTNFIKTGRVSVSLLLLSIPTTEPAFIKQSTIHRSPPPPFLEQKGKNNH